MPSPAEAGLILYCWRSREPAPTTRRPAQNRESAPTRCHPGHGGEPAPASRLSAPSRGSAPTRCQPGRGGESAPASRLLAPSRESVPTRCHPERSREAAESKDLPRPRRGNAPACSTQKRSALSVSEARFWARVGVLAALALVLGYIETFIPLPVPVPGIKLGLGNIAVLAALELLDVRAGACVAAVKVLAAGFLFGNPLMMLYSAGGTALAFAAMAALTRISGLSVVLVAIVGAVLHNIGQLAVAGVILGTSLVWWSAPVLVVAACATGAVTGMAARYAIGCLKGAR